VTTTSTRVRTRKLGPHSLSWQAVLTRISDSLARTGTRVVFKVLNVLTRRDSSCSHLSPQSGLQHDCSLPLRLRRRAAQSRLRRRLPVHCDRGRRSLGPSAWTLSSGCPLRRRLITDHRRQHHTSVHAAGMACHWTRFTRGALSPNARSAC